MLKKVIQRLRFGANTFDPVDYWRGRATGAGTSSVMWTNATYNSLVDADEWRVISDALPTQREACLDLGCGTGRMAERLASGFSRYTGVDITEMVAEAARRHPHLATSFVDATVQSYSYPSNTFDFILSLGCLATACTASTLPRVAAQLAQALKPGGRLLLIEPFHRSRLLTRGCRLRPTEVAAVFTAEGVELVDRDGILFFPVRMFAAEVLGEQPTMTRTLYHLGERVGRVIPRSTDYAVLCFQRPAG